MADTSQISGQLSAQIQGKISGRAPGKALVPTENRPEGYQKADEVKTDARSYQKTFQSRDSAEIRKGLLRLNQLLGKDQPLDQDVPRGFYLNIKV